MGIQSLAWAGTQHSSWAVWWALSENDLHSLVYLHPKLMNYLKGLGGVCSLTVCVARGGLQGFKIPHQA